MREGDQKYFNNISQKGGNVLVRFVVGAVICKIYVSYLHWCDTAYDTLLLGSTDQTPISG